MTIQDDTTAAPAPAFAHMLYPYTGAQAYLDGTLAFIDKARAAGATVVIAAHDQRRALLSEHLVDDKDVVFMDTAALGRNPGRLIPAWREWIGQASAHGSVHGVSDPAWRWPNSVYESEARYREWLLNRAFAQTPAWSLLCPVDTSGRDAAQIAALARCHPLVWNGTAHQPSSDYLADAYRFDELPDPPPGHQRLDYTVETLRALREHVADWARGYRLDATRVRELMLVVSELSSNSVRHGGGSGTLRLWSEADALVCEFRDAGVITDPLAGHVRPPTSQLGGRGLWFVNQLCDLVQIRTAPGRGSCVRIWIDLPGE